MTTTTARYGLTKINVLTDNVDVVTDFNNNADAIDLKLGTQVCTSSTRPSSPVQGQLAFETDTGYVRKYNGTSWTTVGNANATSGSLPANPLQGDFVYLTDIGAIAYYSGGAWHTASLIVCTSSTRPTGGSLQTGSFIYETDTLRLMVWNGSAWLHESGALVVTSSTHPATGGQGKFIYETDTHGLAVYSGSNYLYTMTQIAPTQNVSAASSVTFSGIQPVRALLLMWRLRSSTAGSLFSMQIDSDTTVANYWTTKLGWHNGTLSGTTQTQPNPAGVEIGTVAGNTTANYFGSGECLIQGWNATNGFCTTKSSSAAWDSSSGYWREEQQGIYIGSTVAHTALKVLPAAGTITGEVSLYGVF
jgi:hypothetical protein